MRRLRAVIAAASVCVSPLEQPRRQLPCRLISERRGFTRLVGHGIK